MRLIVTSLAALLALGAADATAAPFNVTKLADTNDGSCAASNCSLRDAVIASNATVGPNTINLLLAGDYKLTIAGANEHAAATGDLNITTSIAISGLGAATTTIDANGIDRIFEVLSGADLAVSGVTLTGGAAVPAMAGVPALGGAVLDNAGGSLTFTDSAIVGNSAAVPTQGGKGGAIEMESSNGSVTFTNTALTGDRAGGLNGTSDEGYGGVVDDSGSGALTFTNATVTGNHAGDGGAFGYGGVVYDSSGPLTVSGSTISHNTAGGGGGGGFGYGGAFDVGTATVTDSTFSGNQAGGGGGGAFGYGGAIEAGTTVGITRGVLTGNTAGGGGNGGSGAFGYGGAIDALGGTVTLTDSTVSGNSAGGGDANSFGYGGAANVGAGGSAVRSTISGNTAGGGGGFGYGGGIAGSTGPLTVANSTISGNAAGGNGGYGNGGGIDAGSGTLSLSSSTVAANTATRVTTQGGGGGVNGALTAQSSIVADNASASGPNCSAAATSLGHNIESGTSCAFNGPGDQIGEPLLGPLQNNGGITPTQALLSGSPAVDHGGGCPATDQRGVVRPQGIACDIGAYELAPPSALTGPASAVGPTAATLAGAASNPDVVAGTVFFQWGTSTAYTSQTPAQPLAAITASNAVVATPANLPPNTVIHFRAVASNPDGTTFGADHTFRTRPLVLRPSSISAASLTHKRFRVTRQATAISAAARHKQAPLGTRVRFTLSAAAKLTIAITRSAPGLRRGRGCVAPTATLRRLHAKRCTRTLTVGTLTRSSEPRGADSVAFSGRIGHRPLSPHAYKALLSASNAGGRSKPVTLSFTVVR